jgi:hypothetical protein
MSARSDGIIVAEMPQDTEALPLIRKEDNSDRQVGRLGRTYVITAVYSRRPLIPKESLFNILYRPKSIILVSYQHHGSNFRRRSSPQAFPCSG